MLYEPIRSFSVSVPEYPTAAKGGAEADRRCWVFWVGGLVPSMGDWRVVKGSIENRIINIGNYYHCTEHPPMCAVLAAKGPAADKSHGIFGAKTKRGNCGGPWLD